MSRHKNKEELVKSIKKERRLLEQSLSNLSEQEMLLAGVVGEWSVKDIPAHLKAWEELLLIWYRAGIQGTAPDIESVGMSAKAIAAVNERFFHQYENWPLERVLIESQISYEKTLSAIEAIPEEDIFAQGRFAWTGRLTLAQYIVPYYR